jgi:hypothetical protein
MFQKKKPIPDADDLERFKQEAQKLQQIEDGLKTPFGKFIMSMLLEYKNKALSEFSSKDISELDDLQTMSWTYSVRGKLQLLNDIEKTLLRAKEDKEAIVKELKQYSA